MGPIEQNIAKQCYSTGVPMPDSIANAPELILGSQLYLQAFFDLDCERSHGMGLTWIPWSSIRDYAAAFEFDDRQTEDLFYYVKKMDHANLERLAEKMPK